jgi:hypothetical protein
MQDDEFSLWLVLCIACAALASLTTFAVGLTKARDAETNFETSVRLLMLLFTMLPIAIAEAAALRLVVVLVWGR